MIEKFRTLAWFLKRPTHWEHALALVSRKVRTDHDTPAVRRKAGAWAADHAIPYADALKKLGIDGEAVGLDKAVIEEGQRLATRSRVQMGGPGDLDLLFDAVRLTGATRVIETGVAYGWSSLAILHAMSLTGGGKLFSVDMPYPKMGNDEFVGIVVPEPYQDAWKLFREPDRRGLQKAIVASGGQVDLCHYDSDKSWWGRAYGFPLMWEALRPGGVFISDDIQDNFFFAEFAKEKSLPFAVTESQGKFVGLLRKQ